jgi:flagellar hook protein FlgE
MQSAMNAAVSGLLGNTQKVNAIAQNIAGANTDGYKRTEILFSTLVTGQGAGSAYSPGGTRSNSISHINEAGDLRSSDITTDLAIDGNGYFIVSPQPTQGVSPLYYYTRAGAFRPDNNGYLRNTSGYYLQGFATDSSGDPLAVNQSVLSSLQTVNVSQVNGISTPTSNIRLGLNLPSLEAVGSSPHIETMAVYDSLGVQQLLNFSWSKVAQTGTTQTWNLSINSPTASFQNITKASGGSYGGDVTGLTAVATAFTATAINDTYSTGGPSGAVTSAVVTGTFPTATVSIVVGGESYVSQTTVAPVIGGQLTLVSATVPGNQIVLDYDPVSVAAIGTEANLQTALRTFFGTAGVNAQFGQNPMVIVFDQDGAPVSFDGASTPPSVIVDWSDSLTNAANNTIALDLGTVGQLNGAICKAGPYDVTFTSQDGVQFGNFNGVSINSAGVFSASFDNGQSLNIFKIPLANFAAPNLMNTKSGDVFAQTEQSGTYLIKFSGTGGIGIISGQTLESSTSDLATEFSNMIIAQRAFTANTKVIITSDQMLSDLESVKR